MDAPRAIAPRQHQPCVGAAQGGADTSGLKSAGHGTSSAPISLVGLQRPRLKVGACQDGGALSWTLL